MKHRVSGRKLGRNTNQRQALFKTLLRSLFTHGLLRLLKPRQNLSFLKPRNWLPVQLLVIFELIENYSMFFRIKILLTELFLFLKINLPDKLKTLPVFKK